MGIAALLDVSLWVNWLSILANIATFLGFFIAGTAAIYAMKQHKESIMESRRTAAYSIYQQYLILCFDNPDLARGFAKLDVKNDKRYEEYCWFVSSALFAFEQIIHTEANRSTWKKTIKAQLLYHKKHLTNSSTIKNKLWEEELQKIIDSVISQPEVNSNSEKP